MEKKICPRCGKEINNTDNVLYKCIKCFTKYCKECEGSKEARNCPECQLSHRMVLSQD